MKTRGSNSAHSTFVPRAKNIFLNIYFCKLAIKGLDNMCKLIFLCILASLGPYYMKTRGSNSAHSTFVPRAKNIFLNIYFCKLAIKGLDNMCKLIFLCILASLGPYYMKIIKFKLCAFNFCPKGKKYFFKYIFFVILDLPLEGCLQNECCS